MKEADINFEDKFKECNDRFKKTFKLTSAASKIIDSELTILKVNAALTDLLGYTAEEIEGTRILDYACPAYKHHWHDLQNAMWKEGKPFFKLDACIIRKDKSLAWVHVTTILYSDNGQCFGFTVLDDYSYLKSFEESEHRLNMALQYSKMAIWEANPNDGSLIHSEGFNQIFNKDNSFNAWNIDLLLEQFIPEDKNTLYKLLYNAQNDAALDFQGRVQTTDGAIKWVNLKAKTEGKSEDGKPGKFLGTLYDITKDKLSERHKDDFISIASHELRTPVTSLKASLQLMARVQTVPDKMLKLIDQANKSMQKVNALIENLINATKVDQGQLQLKKTRFKISRIIKECVDYISGTTAFNLIIDTHIDPEVYADFERIQQVLVNFLNNAMKYSQSSTNIYIRIQKEDEYVKVDVVDQGKGIESEKIPNLFTRYTPVSRDSSLFPGLGLGLYISSEIIKKHGGDIGVISQPDKGSTFWFKIPLG